jgi:site-specific DNA-methyltransferase (cytosine-N4-specific)
MARDKTRKLTRFSRIHPYPAMIADELAVSLCKKYVKPGANVLDPFCGTARTLLAAAELGAHCVGVDVNPLGLAIARAKAARPPLGDFRRILSSSKFSDYTGVKQFDLQPGRSVQWYAKRSIVEISRIISWVNSLRLRLSSVRVLGAIVSAVAREVSYCRKDQWKLHRMFSEQRRKHRISAWAAFRRRMAAYLREATAAAPLKGTCTFVEGDACELQTVLRRSRLPLTYDFVLTSPPYGDSKTTVGYGGISSICLAALRHIRRLSIAYKTEKGIDSRCLGGSGGPIPASFVRSAAKYWYRSADEAAKHRVFGYLHSLRSACEQLAGVVSEGGTVVFVVARRSVKGRRVRTDTFLVNTFAQLGLRLQDVSYRKIQRKNTPATINRNARGKRSKRTRTMRTEAILVFRKS